MTGQAVRPPRRHAALPAAVAHQVTAMRYDGRLQRPLAAAAGGSAPGLPPSVLDVLLPAEQRSLCAGKLTAQVVGVLQVGHRPQAL